MRSTTCTLKISIVHLRLVSSRRRLGASAQPTNLTGTIRLFVDPRLVDEASGFTPTVGPVTKDAQNPLLVEDRLYDVRWDNTYM